MESKRPKRRPQNTPEAAWCGGKSHKCKAMQLTALFISSTMQWLRTGVLSRVTRGNLHVSPSGGGHVQKHFFCAFLKCFFFGFGDIDVYFLCTSFLMCIFYFGLAFSKCLLCCPLPRPIAGAPQRPVEAFGPPAALPASALVHSALSGGASTGSAGGHKTYHRPALRGAFLGLSSALWRPRFSFWHFDDASNLNV